MQALFYGIPVIYPLAMAANVSPAFAKVILVNPIAQAIQDVRYLLIDPENTPTAWNYINSWPIKMIPIVLTFAIFAAGFAVFKKHSRKFAEVI